MDSCLFYKSFNAAAKSFPDELRLEFYDYLFECCFEDLPLDEVPFPYQPVIIQMLASGMTKPLRTEPKAEGRASRSTFRRKSGRLIGKITHKRKPQHTSALH